MKFQEILSQLPYSPPFLFVDKILHIDDNSAIGEFYFNKEMSFYEGHFKNNAITPGVILTECCAQIGLVCLGIYLINKSKNLDIHEAGVILTSSNMEFLKPVYPEEKVKVVSEKVYFRFNKLKCKVKMFNHVNELICKGEIAGFIKSTQK
ncbi:MAG: hydroxymyristoyl-ACP dehydratase [Eudoraea sp.]|uniref:3-hydroxyacyl-ACP dehydratase FabZ family protein n=1 Tax=Eudoraea sp. TaxID=1979955 RepID=UPI003C748C89